MFWLVTFLQGIFEQGEVADYDQVAGESVEFEIYPDEGLASVQQRLVDEGIVASPEAFQQALADLEPGAVHHDGTYPLREQMPAAEAVEVIFAQREGQATFSVPLGSRQDEVFELIAGVQELDITVEELQELAEDPQQFGLPEQAESLEGFLAGGDHFFEYEATAEEVLQELISSTFRVLEENGVTDPDEQWETIIVASLITAEANNNYDPEERTRDERYEDYRIMAGAIQNRINNPDHDGIGGLLQIDAAVHYGSGRTGDLHFSDEDRLDEDNEYNTYVHPGLPPGPIGTPIWDTIRAAANPADTDYFYWVTVNPNTGETEFNRTHDEHLEDVAVFNQFCEDNPGACSPADEQAAEEELEE
nr:endolytic transglycosylase MltG [Nesterenkonia alkaliphila]